MNADSGGVTRLTNDPAAERFPSWSPDGKKIAFFSNRDGNGDIYIMNADGSGVTRLTDPLDRCAMPAWSPDGRQIAMECMHDEDPEIYVMNADGSGLTRLTNNSGEDWLQSVSKNREILFLRTIKGYTGFTRRPGHRYYWLHKFRGELIPAAS